MLFYQCLKDERTENGRETVIVICDYWFRVNSARISRDEYMTATFGHGRRAGLRVPRLMMEYTCNSKQGMEVAHQTMIDTVNHTANIVSPRVSHAITALICGAFSSALLCFFPNQHWIPTMIFHFVSIFCACYFAVIYQGTKDLLQTVTYWRREFQCR